jgi:hypothetical protein
MVPPGQVQDRGVQQFNWVADSKMASLLLLVVLLVVTPLQFVVVTGA